LQQSLEGVRRPEYRLEEIATGLEEAFIHLMQNRGENSDARG